MSGNYTIQRIVEREGITDALIETLAEINAELATCPEHKIGSKWCLDRLAQRNRTLKALGRYGVLN